MKVYNDLQRIETPLLESMLNAFTTDYGRLLTTAELIVRERTIALLQVEIMSRKRPGLDVAVII